MKEVYGIIYKTIFPNGKIYIGQTTLVNWKWYFGSGIKVSRIIKENGTAELQREILRECRNSKELDNWERILIKKFDSTNPDIGYNVQLGGGGKGKFTDDIKMKISISVSKTMTKERREQISKRHKGKSMSETTLKRMSKATKGKNNPMYGKRGKESPMFGRSWINDGNKSRFIDISEGVPQGYTLGRLKFKSI